MNNQWLNTNVRRAGVALILGVCVFGGSAVSRYSGFFARPIQEFALLSRDSQTQWLLVVCVLSYFFLFHGLQNRAVRGGIWRCDGAVTWLASLMGIGLLAYVFDVPTASKSTQLLIVLSGATLGAAARWAAGGRHGGAGATALPSVLAIWLLAASFCQATSDLAFEYHGQVRWTGPWYNPNIFGLLMGTGTILAGGLAGTEWKRKDGKGKDSVSRKFRVAASARFAFCLLAMIFLGRGLFHSLSRGAWMATGCGLGYLGGYGLGVFGAGKTTAAQVAGAGAVVKTDRDRWICLTRSHGVAAGVLVVSVSALCFWHFRGTEWHAARRAFSALDAVDFSWRNRSAAWEGALQISAEHPWLGVGWNQCEPLYENYYVPRRLTESAAIQMNDYLTLAVTLGIPTLFCLGMYLWLSLTRNAKCESQIGRPTANADISELGFQKSEVKLDWLETTCHAGTIVLLVGFWFDGGLFELATASTFWTLLELGKVEIKAKG
jgi:O-antigen ligase